jgi:hypothetical protein
MSLQDIMLVGFLLSIAWFVISLAGYFYFLFRYLKCFSVVEKNEKKSPAKIGSPLKPVSIFDGIMGRKYKKLNDADLNYKGDKCRAFLMSGFVSFFLSLVFLFSSS